MARVTWRHVILREYGRMGKAMLIPLLSFLDDCAMLNNLEEYVIDLMSCSALAATPFLLSTMPVLTLKSVATLPGLSE